MAEVAERVTSEHVLELRYKANPKILDYRGTWAELISKHMELSEWRIVENRVDVYSKTQHIHAFVGFRNMGFVATDPPTANYFPDQAIKLLRFVFNLDGFGDPIFIERIGVRSRYCTESKGTFEQLCERYSTRFITLTSEAKKAFGDKSKLIDIGCPLNFADNLGNFNTMSGPMGKKQLTEFFKKKEDYPEVGLYFDIDYWQRPEKELGSKEVTTRVRSFAEAAWQRHEEISNLILRG